MKVAILNVNKGKLSKDSLDKIRKCGVEVVRGTDYSADIVFARNRLENFQKYRNLKWIHTSWAGVNTFLTDEMRKSKVVVTNSKGAYNSTVAEHAVALMLALNRGINLAALAQDKKAWKEFEGADELYGKTVGIIGAGNIGGNIARLCKAFGCKTIGTNRSGKKGKYIDNMFPAAKMHGLLRESDYIVICLPLTDETRHVISRKEFAAMRKSSVLINVGRGPLIHEKALVEALKKGKIKAAGLDVFELEPLPKSSPLWGMKNVIITAHYAGYTPYHEGRVVDIFCKNLEAFLKGKNMINVIDKEKGY